VYATVCVHAYICRHSQQKECTRVKTVVVVVKTVVVVVKTVYAGTHSKRSAHVYAGALSI